MFTTPCLSNSTQPQLIILTTVPKVVSECLPGHLKARILQYPKTSCVNVSVLFLKIWVQGANYFVVQKIV